jgi:hypothetical protein
MTIVGDPIQWGDVAAWTSSGLTSIGLLRMTRREQGALQAERRQSQARKVSAWCERVEVAPDHKGNKVVVRLKNASDEPIYGVRVAVGRDWLSEPIEYETLPVDYVLEPDYDQAHSVTLHPGAASSADSELSPPVEIIFSDASGGRFWWRDRYGGLTELTTTDAVSPAEHFFTNPVSAPAGWWRRSIQ